LISNVATVVDVVGVVREAGGCGRRRRQIMTTTSVVAAAVVIIAVAAAVAATYDYEIMMALALSWMTSSG